MGEESKTLQSPVGELSAYNAAALEKVYGPLQWIASVGLFVRCTLKFTVIKVSYNLS